MALAGDGAQRASVGFGIIGNGPNGRAATYDEPASGFHLPSAVRRAVVATVPPPPDTAPDASAPSFTSGASVGLVSQGADFQLPSRSAHERMMNPEIPSQGGDSTGSTQNDDPAAIGATAILQSGGAQAASIGSSAATAPLYNFVNSSGAASSTGASPLLIALGVGVVGVAYWYLKLRKHHGGAQ